MAMPLPATRQASLTIDTLGARGDGIASLDGKPVYIPFTLPGEIIQAEIVQARGDGLSAVVRTIERASPLRAQPPCPHFGICGGCAVQHFDYRAYLAWKRQLVGQALQRRGFAAVPVGEIVATPPARRRRAVLTAMRTRKAAIIGFHERASHRLVDLTVCRVLLPSLEALIAPLRDLLTQILAVGQNAQVALNDTDSGIDCQIAADHAPDLAAREAMAAFTEKHDLARIAWRQGGESDPVAQRRLPVLKLGAAIVGMPPGGFLQASREGENAMRQAVREWTQDAKSVIDLFGGVGTLSLELLPDKRVHLVEGNADAVAAVTQAARLPALQSKLRAEQRDLAAEPMMAETLQSYDAAIIDPPRAGAVAQARELASSGIGTIVYVSCDPGTFARDARILVDGGYALEQVVPIDQFLWSGHVELVALFRRKRL
ncbi:MAG: putative (Uracil-5-)-methyltransferase [Alphaproteobacteria bacterium]|jgi:23S rRNA (uracil1939-C5)-methyltransferase|nr:putative (Uracil-5-)-methyltransferase [Alphaproteobacteria bacterium]